MVRSVAVPKTDDNWQRLDDAFAIASSLDGPERQRFLAAFAERHPALSAQLRDLLAADGDDDSVLERPIQSAVENLIAESADVWEGREIGAWRIVRRIADGGMGAVFLAERRNDEFAQTVAIKIMAARMLAADAADRFRAERQILANLNHPNIASLIDGGTTEDKLPYLVMEYVDGPPIDEYCRLNDLGLDERLRLFNKVCRAVNFAHRNLVVHRDLKPGNILVDARGEPKLLDFGIAKLLEDNPDAGGAALTRVGSRLMTPEYASPEQIRGEAPTVATDVYALGVLLYHLLTGQQPYGVDDGDVPGLETAILTVDATRPSIAVGRSGHPDLVENRLAQRLAGDLDNITLKAIQKDPARRYGTAIELSADIRNYLEHRPVTARPESWSYLAGKFLRRHRAGVTFTAAFLLSVAALSTYYTIEVTDQRDIALREAAKATQVSNFLTRLFESSDPGEARGKTVTADELLERGTERIHSELTDQPAVRAAMLNVIGDVQRKLGDSAEAVKLLQEGLEVSEGMWGSEHPETATSAHLLGLAYKDQGEFSAAEEHLRDALRIRRAELGDTHVTTLGTARDLANTLYLENKYDEAEPLYREAMGLVDTSLGADREFASTMTQYGQLLKARGRYDEAESLLRGGMDIRRQLFGDDHPDLGDSYFNLAQLLELTGEFDESEQFFRRALQLDTQMFGERHPYIASDKTNLARLLSHLERYEESEALYREAVALRREIVAPGHPDLATDLYYYAGLLLLVGRYEEAEALLLESLEIRRQAYDGPHRVIADNLASLGRAKLGQDDMPAAFDYLQQSLAMRREKLGDGHHEVADGLSDLAVAWAAAGDLENAERYARDSIAVYEGSVGESHPRAIRALLYLAGVLLSRGKPVECASAAARARELAGRLPQPNPDLLADAGDLQRQCAADPGRAAAGR